MSIFNVSIKCPALQPRFTLPLRIIIHIYNIRAAHTEVSSQVLKFAFTDILKLNFEIGKGQDEVYNRSTLFGSIPDIRERGRERERRKASHVGKPSGGDVL